VMLYLVSTGDVCFGGIFPGVEEFNIVVYGCRFDGVGIYV
jgi:hypothetical protein